MLQGAAGTLWAVAAGFALTIHSAIDEISCRAIIAGVELREPLALLVLAQATTDLVGVGPHHGRVVPNGGGELERLHPFPVKELHFIIPVCYGLGPICQSAGLRLLVGVKVLPDLEPL